MQKQTRIEWFTVLMFFVMVAVGLLIYCSDAKAQEEIKKDWGIITKMTNGCSIDVPVALSDSKFTSDFLAQSDFKKETVKADEVSLKLLRNLWNIPEVANMRWSTWQILLLKPRLIVWDDKVYGEIEKAMDIWWAAVGKKEAK